MASTCVTFFIKTLTGKTIIIEAEANNRIKQIKDKIYDKEGIPPCNQKLIYAGKWLNDNKTLNDYNIKNDDTLHLMGDVRGMINVEEKKDDDCISFSNKSHTKSIKLDSYHISNKSDRFDGNDMIGIILYSYNGELEWKLNDIKCKCGYIYLCKTVHLKNISSSPINSLHAKCYKKLFGEDPNYTKIVAAGFGYMHNEWIWKIWKYNSGTFNAPNHCAKRNKKLATYYKMDVFEDKWHDNNRRMHEIEEKWLKKIIKEWISSKCIKTTLYISYVTWSWWKEEWIDYDEETNKYLENEYKKYIININNDNGVNKINWIDLNVGNFLKNDKLRNKYRVYFSAPNISINSKNINSLNNPKWKNDKDERNKYFLQKNYIANKYRIVRRRNLNEIQSNNDFYQQYCVCL